MIRIYAIRNSKNKKVYIGQTSKTLKERFKYHDKKLQRGAKYKLYEAMDEIGRDNFWIEELDSTESVEEGSRLERFYIDKYDSIEYGYNRNYGGKISRNSRIASIDQLKPLIDANLERRTKVISKNLETGENKVHDSIQEAARWLGFGRKEAPNIHRVLNGKRKSAFGYYWKYHELVTTTENASNDGSE